MGPSFGRDRTISTAVSNFSLDMVVSEAIGRCLMLIINRWWAESKLDPKGPPTPERREKTLLPGPKSSDRMKPALFNARTHPSYHHRRIICRKSTFFI